MDYKLFDDFITLQALLKEIGITQSGGAIKGFLQDNTVFFNGNDEKRRGKKIRVGDRIDLPNQNLFIEVIEPNLEEKEQHQQDKAEKERVAALVKQLNQKEKKPTGKKGQKESQNPQPKKPVRFPGT